MTQQEFETRVLVKVSTSEYWHINEVYNNSDLDKDEFCKLWVKMNQGRVSKAKEEAKREAEDWKQREGLYDIIAKDWSNLYDKAAYKHLNKKERQLLDTVGISIDDDTYSWIYPTRVRDVIYQIEKYLKVA